MVKEQCANPNAPQVPCVNCGKPVFTCERENAADNSYLCPQHPDGVEDIYGQWFCSRACWNDQVADAGKMVTLTDAEREACGLIVMHLDYAGRDHLAATLRGLLERLGGEQ